MAITLLERGLLRANPDATITNGLRLDDCPCTDGAPCRDLFSGAVVNTATMTSATIDGEVRAFTAGILVTNTAAIQAQLETWLGTDVSPRNQEFNVWVRVTYTGGTTLRIEHNGERTISQVITSAGTHALTRTCTTAVNCEHTASLVDEIGAITDDNGATSAALPNNPYEFTGTPATDAATATQLDTDITAALTTLGTVHLGVTVTPNVLTSAYDVTVLAAQGLDLNAGSVAFVAFNCQLQFG